MRKVEPGSTDIFRIKSIFGGLLQNTPAIDEPQNRFMGITYLLRDLFDCLSVI